jgi:hypothetical protein
MGTFNGKVKRVSGDRSQSGNCQTIVVVSGDLNNEVDCVKVIFPTDLDPSEIPVICDYSDTQNGDRIFTNNTLTLNASAQGKTVNLYISMVDANDNVLGTDTVQVTIE